MARVALMVLAGLCVGTVLPRSAHAAECASYGACEVQMLEANRAKDYPAAQRAAETAYRLRPDPNLLFNLGRFHHKQGHKTEAIEHYQRFLTSGDSSITPKRRQDIDGYLTELRKPDPVASPPPATPLLTTPPPTTSPLTTQPPPLRDQARLGWRFYSGVPLALVGLGLTGVGATVLALDGQCTTNELPCPRRYSDNLGKGVGMLVPGVVALGVGVTLSIVDLSRRRKATLLSQR